MFLTWKARVVADPATTDVLADVLYSATKVYNGLLWNLRQELEQTGKSDLSLKHLNKLLGILPRAMAMYADCAQQVFFEIKEAYESFFALRDAGKTDRNAPGFRHKERLSPITFPRVNHPKAGAKIARDETGIAAEISLGTRNDLGGRAGTARSPARSPVRSSTRSTSSRSSWSRGASTTTCGGS
ncbi:MAG: hypothetical protein HYV63_03635 [Candidatus Schekmanbacteria bacterium]|nr:hypothetical protein [Candidatus Schekmanbacteria bacterium]